MLGAESATWRGFRVARRLDSPGRTRAIVLARWHRRNPPRSRTFGTHLNYKIAPGLSRIPFGRDKMLWTIVVILLILWALGFALHIGAGLIHLLLVVALIVVVVNLVSGRRAL